MFLFDASSTIFRQHVANFRHPCLSGPPHLIHLVEHHQVRGRKPDRGNQEKLGRKRIRILQVERQRVLLRRRKCPKN